MTSENRHLDYSNCLIKYTLLASILSPSSHRIRMLKPCCSTAQRCGFLTARWDAWECAENLKTEDAKFWRRARVCLFFLSMQIKIGQTRKRKKTDFEIFTKKYHCFHSDRLGRLEPAQNFGTSATSRDRPVSRGTSFSLKIQPKLKEPTRAAKIQNKPFALLIYCSQTELSDLCGVQACLRLSIQFQYLDMEYGPA